MGGANFGKVVAGLIEAELSVDGEADFRGVWVFLAVVFPPADRAQLERAGSFESFISTAGAAIAHYDGCTHTGIDGAWAGGDYEERLVVSDQWTVVRIANRGT